MSLVSGESLLLKRESPSLLSHRVEYGMSHCVFQNKYVRLQKSWWSLDPCLWCISATLESNGEGFPSVTSIFQSIQQLMWDNGFLLSHLCQILTTDLCAQPLYSQQPGIHQRGCFPRSSSSGVSVSGWDKLILQVLPKRQGCLLPSRIYSLNTFFRFIENNQIKSISPQAFRGLKTLVHL